MSLLRRIYPANSNSFIAALYVIGAYPRNAFARVDDALLEEYSSRSMRPSEKLPGYARWHHGRKVTVQSPGSAGVPPAERAARMAAFPAKNRGLNGCHQRSQVRFPNITQKSRR